MCATVKYVYMVLHGNVPINSTPHSPILMEQCWEICQPILAPGVGKRGVFAQAAVRVTEVKAQYKVEAEQVCSMAALKSCHSTKLVGRRLLGSPNPHCPPPPPLLPHLEEVGLTINSHIHVGPSQLIDFSIVAFLGCREVPHHSPACVSYYNYCSC